MGINSDKKKQIAIDDIDYLELYVGNAKQAAFFFQKLFGFKTIAYSSLETGNREHTSYVLSNNEITIVVTAANTSDCYIADYVKKHGDSISNIAFTVENLSKAYEFAVHKGAIVVEEPVSIMEGEGYYAYAKIKAFGEVVHTFVEKKNYSGVFAPGFVAIDDSIVSDKEQPNLLRVDHLAICVENMNEWINYYEQIFGFDLLNSFTKDEISSKSSSLMTKILKNGSERVKLSIIEPAVGKKNSQINEFLQYHNGPGIQHIALLTDDIIQCINSLKKNGVEFLYVPKEYYEALNSRVGEIDESINDLRRLQVLVDRDEEGYLLQIFGKPITNRPTLFFEIIQRKGSRGFGNGNIKALFEAVEREQARRGNL
ncbi:4-hydroxyphenylpyruvate dioxygenase [Paenibacillus sp. MER TA 81-3]|uniref:4-hydroxyphenylpyruvate dioxygenase n=1 Tax=Paenibacillus sp. MER TA 81-3 TaxID=2939573 RepID=UPI00203BB8E6|nr:4-hydroxyphenylpyruvate dioxygenase [Paenibacillus sp. MER TA 81-3]MCM3340702.1 4-hydroxyphenylpyruvate dioxygenase [Paenibacillus sp. MER TA 81-3]